MPTIVRENVARGVVMDEAEDGGEDAREAVELVLTIGAGTDKALLAERRLNRETVVRVLIEADPLEQALLVHSHRLLWRSLEPLANMLMVQLSLMKMSPHHHHP